MASAAVTHIFVNGTAADAIQMNTNFDDLVDFLNDEVIHADGSKDFTDNVSQPTTPTDPDHLTRKGYVDDQVALLIPKSIVDAAGDLIVADAADSVVRMAKGADGQLLKVVAGSVVWGASSLPPLGSLVAGDGTMHLAISNNWLPVGGNHTEAVTAPAPVANLIEYIGPFYVTSSFNVDNLGIAFSSIGTGVNFRLAIYTGATAPTTLLVESGSTTGVAGANGVAASITSTALQPGVAYWMAVNYSTAQGGVYHYGTGSEFRATGGGFVNPFYSVGKKFNQAHTYGTFPATATPVAVVNSTAPGGVPNLWVQVV